MIELRLDAFDVAILIFVIGVAHSAGAALGKWAWRAVSNVFNKRKR